jgi:hypothetical protein
LGETSRHLMGESIIETIYIDDWRNWGGKSDDNLYEDYLKYIKKY